MREEEKDIIIKSKLLFLSVHALKACSSQFVCLSVFLCVCNSDFSKYAKNVVLASARTTGRVC